MEAPPCFDLKIVYLIITEITMKNRIYITFFTTNMGVLNRFISTKLLCYNELTLGKTQNQGK